MNEEIDPELKARIVAKRSKRLSDIGQAVDRMRTRARALSALFAAIDRSPSPTASTCWKRFYRCSTRRLKMTREEYEAIDAVNWSTLKHMGKSGEHYLHNLNNKGEDSDARQRGRVLHFAVFEPERLTREVVVYPERRAGKEWQAFEAKHAGKEIITSRMDEAVKRIGARARSHPMAARYLAGGKGEHTVTWTHRSPGIEGHLAGWEMACKGRLDFVADVGAIVDLKSTRDASPTGFGREAARYEYHAQLAFYRDGYEAMTGVRLPVIIVAIEAAAPYVVQVYRLDDELLDLGRERYELLLSQLRICREENRWGGYAEAEIALELPRWARPLDDDEEVDADLVFAE